MLRNVKFTCGIESRCKKRIKLKTVNKVQNVSKCPYKYYDAQDLKKPETRESNQDLQLDLGPKLRFGIVTIVTPFSRLDFPEPIRL